MDRSSRAEQDWKLVTVVLLRQFAVRDLVALCSVALGVWAATREHRMIVGVLAGGGWMAANCLVIVWMGAKALQYRDAKRSLYLLGFMTAVFALFVVGSWLAFACQSMGPGMAFGLAISLAVFLLQVRRLKLRLEFHAR
jgi:hypothetical protein